MAVLVSRDQLYEFAWSAPMRDLAAKVGMSDVGLKKLLAGFGVPAPPQGYWNKVHAGKRVPPRPTPRLGASYMSPAFFTPPLRDFLMELATGGLFRAKWSDEIHEDWIRNLLVNRPDLEQAKLEKTRELMNQSAMDCLVSGYEHLIPAMQCPDQDDRHVIAAAIHARADAIVTFNLKDFPSTALAPYNLEAVHPDEFMTFQADPNLATVLTAAQRRLSRLCNPPKTADEYLDTLNAQALTKTVGVLRRYAKIL